MTSSSRKGPIIDPGICRCCGASKKCRLLNVEYEWLGQKEVYSDLFVDTFGLLLSNLDSDPSGRLICATCVTRLRDASAFRKQVLLCEERLLQAQIHVDGFNVLDKEIKEESELKVEIEPDPAGDVDDGIHCDEVPAYEDYDSDTALSLVKAEPLPKVSKSKKEKKLTKIKKTRSSKADLRGRKKESLQVKKNKEGTKIKRALETEARREMLEALQAMGKRLHEMQQIEAPKESKTRDEEQENFHNTATIVENSYVCPFDNSFSDYFCVYCRELFTDPDKLRNHTLGHDPSTFKDMGCNKKMILVDIMRIDCRLCPEIINNIDYLKEHLVNVHGKVIHEARNEFLKFKLTPNNLTCTECNSTFSFFHAVKKHMAEHFGTCICDICGAHYFEERMLVLHQKTHKKIDENYPCSECGKSFKSKHSRYLHEARTHKKEPAYQCPKCDEVLFTYSLRYRHMIEVHGEHRMFQCNHCDRTYDSRKSLREHNRRNHLKILKHQCDLCDKRFYIPSRLKEHMATHTGERNFRCEYCGKSYPRLRGLKVHMQSHNSEKKFRCMLCNASFTQNVNLKNHIKRQHQSLELEEGYHE